MPQATDIKVFIADDHAVTVRQLREFIQASPDMEVVFTASTGNAVLDFFNAGRNGVNVVLMDIGMPRMNGLKATQFLKEKFRDDIKVIAISGLNGDFFPSIAFAHQADGFIAKSRRKTEIIDAIRRAHNGEKVELPEQEISFDEEPNEDPVMDASPTIAASFSPIELRVLKFASNEALTSKEIGKKMRLGVPYVDKIRFNLMTKLGVKNAAQLGSRAMELGLLY